MLQSVFSTTSWCRPRLAHRFVVPSSPHCYIGLKSYCLRLDLWLWRILFVAFALSSYVTKRSLWRAAKIEPALSIVSRFATICHISEKCLSYLVINWPHWGQGQSWLTKEAAWAADTVAPASSWSIETSSMNSIFLIEKSMSVTATLPLTTSAVSSVSQNKCSQCECYECYSVECNNFTMSLTDLTESNRSSGFSMPPLAPLEAPRNSFGKGLLQSQQHKAQDDALAGSRRDRHNSDLQRHNGVHMYTRYNKYTMIFKHMLSYINMHMQSYCICICLCKRMYTYIVHCTSMYMSVTRQFNIGEFGGFDRSNVFAWKQRRWRWPRKW